MNVSFDWQTLLLPGILLFTLVILAIFFLLQQFMGMMTEEDTSIQERLKRISGQTNELEIRSEDQTNILEDMREEFLKLIGPLSKHFYKENNNTMVEQLKNKLMLAGEPDTEEAVQRFLTMKVGYLIIFLGSAILLTFVSGISVLWGLMIIILAALVGNRLPDMGLNGKMGKRRTEIYKMLPDTLDLLVVCIESGLGMDAAINRVGQEMERTSPVWSFELKRLTKELNAGLPRHEVYENLALRTDVEEVRSLCALLIQSDKMGTSVAGVLRVFSDDMRVRRKHKAEEMAQKASIKMTPVLVFFVFPPLMIILLGPGLLRAFDAFIQQGIGQNIGN